MDTTTQEMDENRQESQGAINLGQPFCRESNSSQYSNYILNTLN